MTEKMRRRNKKIFLLKEEELAEEWDRVLAGAEEWADAAYIEANTGEEVIFS
jgi:hypothetical protein